MWDTWNWMGSAISANINRSSDDRSRQMNYLINQERLDKEMRVAQLNADVNRYSIDVANASREKIAEADRLSREEVAKADRESREKVAWLQAIGQVAPKVIPIALGGKLYTDKKNNSNNSNNLSTSGAVSVKVVDPEAEKKSQARKEADKLFPELEPTFKTNNSSKAVKIGLGAVLTGAVMSMLSSMPIII